jgi:hypothetical protein
MMCLRRLWAFLKKDEGYTLAINMTFALVTFGVVMLGIITWYGTAMAGYAALRSAAASAAFAAQAQVIQSVTGTGTGFTAGVDWALQNYQGAANSTFQTQVANMHLGATFTNLQCNTTANSQGISVVVTGDFQPVFLQNIANKYSIFQAVAIPMHVQIQEEYRVVG